ncbi:MAG: low temperature requirement protein A [Actinomycetota bacterium]|nr:low temperature requirement protein A [Actinomycetota bacterium]
MADKRSLDTQEREQQQLVRAPDLNRDEHRSATRLELFFDLALVLFVGGCADLLADDLTWSGAAAFAALVSVGWWSWASTALYANRFDTDDVVFRALTLTGMAGVVAMAASVSDVTGAQGRWFALGYVLVRVVLLLGYARAWQHVPEARPSIRPYVAGHALGAAVWLASVVVPVPLRFVLWGLGVVLDLVGPARAARSRGGVPLHAEHLPERFALLIILVLGESVTGIVTGLEEAGWRPAVVLTAAVAFLVAGLLWWLYFDFSGGIAKRRLLQEDRETRRGVHDVYLYAHLPVAVGLAATAVGLEHVVVHAPDAHVAPAARVLLGGSLALYLGSTAALQALLTGGTRAALLWPGLGVPAVLVVCLVDLRPAVLLALLAVVLLAGLAAGIAQHRAGEVRTAKV